MTFKCEVCEETTKPHDKMHKEFLGVRRVVYGPPENQTFGFEPVKEVKMCPQCAIDCQPVTE